MKNITYIPGEIANAAIDEHGNRKPVTRTQHIFDDAKDKNQAEVNAEVDDTFAFHQSEINALNSQNYVTVDSFSSLPATGAVDTVYRVSNWDGTQQDPSVYSEYAWDGEDYVHLSTKTQIGEVFDISAYHATGGELAKYADLAAALNGGANIPQSLQKGGMSVKFVQSSDNKYVQFRCIANEFTTDVTKWAIDDVGVYVDNPEYIYVKTDNEGKILWAIKANGSIYYGAGVPQQVKDYIEEKISSLSLDEYEDIVAFLSDYLGSDTTLKVMIDGINAQITTKLDAEGLDPDALNSVQDVENPEYIEAKTDSEGKLLAGRTPDGAAFEKVGFSTPKVSIDGATIENIQDPEERSEITTDFEGKVISYRRPNGTVVENTGVETKSLKSESYNFSDKNAQEIKDALNRIGFTTKTPSDHSNQDSIQIPEPYLAVINITSDKGEAFWPTTKTTDAKYWMEFYDGNGNYFKKRIIFNAQGNSSLFFDKKNGSIDICNDEWEGDDTCNIRFGKWTACDSFHLKSYYFDLFKGNGVIAYKIANQIMESRDFNENRPWKKELISADDKDATKVGNPSYSSLDDISLQIDNGARCVPDGFPAIVFLNSEFYGIYAFTYKKHRSNYNMDKATPEHIHLDGGELTSRTIFGGTVSWANFEIRNPKYLVYKTPRNISFDPTNAKQVKKAYQYDADVAQAEIAGTDSPLTFDVATTYTFGQIVVYKNRQYMAMRETIGHTPTQNKKPKNVYDDAAANGYWIDITYTNKVKQYILDLSNRMSQITSAVNPKEELQKYFDLDNIVDYELYVTLTHNIDAQGYNWQLCSWSGEKWYFCVWDAERIWGQVNTFNYLDSVPSEGTLLYGSSAGTPNAWVNDNCKSELKQRWIELVSQKIADKDHIICMIKDWMDRIGSYFYEKEYEKWTLSPCNRDSKFNKTSWKLIGQHSFELSEWNQERTYYEGNETREGINIYKALSANTNKKPSDNPSVWELLSYKEGVQYNVGDRLIVGSDFTYKVECIESTSESPLLGSYSGYPADLGYHDNIWRLYDYISKWIYNLNIYFNSLNV